jgi:hypothetical protein
MELMGTLGTEFGVVASGAEDFAAVLAQMLGVEALGREG